MDRIIRVVYMSRKRMKRIRCFVYRTWSRMEIKKMCFIHNNEQDGENMMCCIIHDLEQDGENKLCSTQDLEQDGKNKTGFGAGWKE